MKNMKQIFTVSQVNSYIHRIFDSDYALRKIFLKGEISNCKYHSSGHIYFTLKDERSALRCVMFSGDRRKGLSFRLENGQLVIVEGNISVFERDGSYQLYAKDISLSGTGELYIRYEQLKKELADRGYFDFDRKKELPRFPRRIGIVTALTGAAIEDIKSIAARRNPFVQLYLYPAKVQGEGAAETIVRGIRYFDRNDVDIIIIGRGGGSIEDLWAFNEPVLADCIYEVKTPIISGTGHEIDMTIADYCADVRAATPSAACELAIPDIFSISRQFQQYRDSLYHGMLHKLQGYREDLLGYERLLETHYPGAKLAQQKMAYQYLKRQLRQVMDRRIRDMENQIALRAGKLHALSPTARLSDGYVFAQDMDEGPVVSVRQITRNEPFQLIFSDGEATVVPISVDEDEKMENELSTGDFIPHGKDIAE